MERFIYSNKQSSKIISTLLFKSITSRIFHRCSYSFLKIVDNHLHQLFFVFFQHSFSSVCLLFFLRKQLIALLTFHFEHLSMDQHFLNSILRELKTSANSSPSKSLQPQSITISFKTENVFKLFSWKLNFVTFSNIVKSMFLIKLWFSTSARPDAYKISKKLYCEVFTDATPLFLLTDTESEISAERLIYLNKKKAWYFFRYLIANMIQHTSVF